MEHGFDFASDHANFFPVNCSYASTYFARVFSTTSSGRAGGGLFLSQPAAVSQSRTNCLSNEGWPRPGDIVVGGPEAGAVGREHFVDQEDLAVNLAELEFRVGDDDPALQGVSGAALEDIDAPPPQLFAQLAAHGRGHLLEGDVLVVAGFGLRGRA